MKYGSKKTKTGDELVYVKDFRPTPSNSSPKLTYPFIDDDRKYYIVSIYPKYHTDLFPDSILNNESPKDFIESEPHRNAIQKVYISRSYFKGLNSGDIIVFYRTGGYYQGVVTTIGVVDKVDRNISSLDQFTKLCRKRSVFKDDELKEHWDYRPNNRPFVVNFLYTYSLPKRPNLKTLIELGAIRDISSVPRGFEEISSESFKKIIEASETNESFIIN